MRSKDPIYECLQIVGIEPLLQVFEETIAELEDEQTYPVLYFAPGLTLEVTGSTITEAMTNLVGEIVKHATIFGYNLHHKKVIEEIVSELIQLTFLKEESRIEIFAQLNLSKKEKVKNA